MPTRAEHLGERLKQIRLAFDNSFALPPAHENAQLQILVCRTASGQFGFRMTELSGIQKLRGITPMPGQTPPLLGITAVLGELVAVFDLTALLKADQAGREPKWMVTTTNGAQRIGLAFESLAGTRRVVPEEILESENRKTEDLTPDAIHGEGGMIQIINLAAVRAIVNSKFRG